MIPKDKMNLKISRMIKSFIFPTIPGNPETDLHFYSESLYKNNKDNDKDEDFFIKNVKKDGVLLWQKD